MEHHKVSINALPYTATIGFFFIATIDVGSPCSLQGAHLDQNTRNPMSDTDHGDSCSTFRTIVRLSGRANILGFVKKSDQRYAELSGIPH